MVDVFTCDVDWEAALADELRRTLAAGQGISPRIAVAGPGCVTLESVVGSANDPLVAFASQCLPQAEHCSATSISAWADWACRRISDKLDAFDGPWRLHVFARPFPDGVDGRRRAQLVHSKLTERLREIRRRLLRRRNEQDQGPWLLTEAWAQVLLTSPSEGYVSVVDEAGRDAWRHVVSPFVAGEIEPAVDKQAPSRAFAKLVEAELRLGRRIAAGETCVDLGASPGSWTYTALARGARVTAIDRSPLRDDLMVDRGLTFVQGDAFAYEPETPVDWLLSDIIAFPDRICELLRIWLGKRLCRQFCVTVKFRGRDDDAALENVKTVLRESGYDFGLRRLTANKNEATAYGRAVS
ncbi:MAG: hypothetical protein JNL96_22340 [Planctomycetaceae bacterium]|nr:hypothetical protein [Planctomycetaceae bacterium]